VRRVIHAALISAIRFYLARSPLTRGKGFITRKLLLPLLPPFPASFVANVPGGGRVNLRYREAIGYAHFIHGGFEKAELKLLSSRLSAGDGIVDVGANIGYFTIPLAMTVGASGMVVACEPEPRNVRRLTENVALNDLDNVEIKQVAIGSHDGTTMLYLGDDSVYHTTAGENDRLHITRAHETGESRRVPLVRLDTLWREQGSPPVAFIKIDVEGTELDVLTGGKELIGACRPYLLIETDQPRLDSVRELLSEFDYVDSHPERFVPSNHLFSPRDRHSLD
jgi:FkbM family methyltransferase